MEVLTEKLNVLRGGEFLVRDTQPADVFIPEEFNEEQDMVRGMIRDFVDQEIRPNYGKIEKQLDGIGKHLVERMGELGMLNSHIPEAYGGTAMDFNTNTIICEEIGASGSPSVSFAAHTGIGMLPILYYGTEEQKQKYLPGLGLGTLKASYCLTEPGSGSDALAAKTRADLTEDGQHYIINGQKMWITNAGFADIFIVFAKIGGEKFTGFIIERETAGVTFGAEEDKMGIKGSSTRQVFFENVKIPVGNLLGAIGKGHLIAFNVLNVGRFKLGVLALGAAKFSTGKAVKYANERHQFKVAIGTFGAIQYKLAEQALRCFVLESSQYRVSQMMRQRGQEGLAKGMTYGDSLLDAAEEYAVECALLKVYGSEALDYVVDETVQVHGGNGFSEEYSAARDYRDSRINRIFEGTNEINRLLMVDMILKRAMKGTLDLVGPAWAVQKELASPPSFGSVDMSAPFALETKSLADYKKILLMVAGGAVKAQMDGKIDLKHEQEILMNIADIAIDVFNCESLLLRIQKMSENGWLKHDAAVYQAMLNVQFHDAQDRIAKWATDGLASFAEGDGLRMMLMGVKRFSKYPPQNVKVARRLVATTLTAANDYCF
jgi:alkylation response protein AidB-like acyl-CoA dehydrogenase